MVVSLARVEAEAAQGGEARSRGRGCSGQAYGAAHGHMTAR
jgi:hypothetical protein